MRPTRRTRIVYWGAAGAGKTWSLRSLERAFQSKMDVTLREVPSDRDRRATIDLLELEVPSRGSESHPVAVVAAPGSASFEEMRTRLLRGADAVVLVVDATAVDANLAALEELGRGLQAVGKAMRDCPMVVQFTKLEGAERRALADLRRKLDTAPGLAEGSVAWVRDPVEAFRAALKASLRIPRAPAEPPPASPPDRDALAHRAQQLFDANWRESVDRIAVEPEGPSKTPVVQHRLESAGQPTILDDHRLRIPIRLRGADGEVVELALTVSLESLSETEEP